MRGHFSQNEIERCLKYQPNNIDDYNRMIISSILDKKKEDKERKIVKLLMNRSKLYLNQIHEIVAESKSTTVEALQALEKVIVTSTWEFNQFKSTKGPKIRAVKVFSISIISGPEGI